MSLLKFYRVSGARNTFVVYDNITQPKDLSSLKIKELVMQLCSGIYGFKNDGLIFLNKTKHSDCDFEWDFYNADGSSAEMCGNAARCAALLYKMLVKNSKNSVQFMTIAGPIKAEIVNANTVRVVMTQIKDLRKASVRVGNNEISGVYVNTGVPHFVVNIPQDKSTAAQLREHSEWGLGGANVTFVNLEDSSRIQAVTYERGVEDFTPACGTGAVAAAIFYNLERPNEKRLQISMPGGDLFVELLASSSPVLEGDAKIDFILELETERFV